MGTFKRFATVIAIAILMPMIVYYGIQVFSPYPEYNKYSVPYTEYQKAKTTDAKQALDQKSAKLNREYKTATNKFYRLNFTVGTVICILAMVVGLLFADEVIGSGLVYGGIFSLIPGYFMAWAQLSSVLRLVALVVILAIVIALAYYRGRMKKT